MRALSLAFLIGAAAACAPTPAAGPVAYAPTILAVRGEGEVKQQARTATVLVGVEVRRATGAEAMRVQAEQMAGVTTALKAAGVADADLQTRNLSLQPDWSWTNQGRKLRGYLAVNYVEATIRDLAKLGETMDAVARAGGLIESQLIFDLETPGGAEATARQEAVKDAMAKATAYAEAMDYKVKRVLSANEPGVRSDYAVLPTAPAERDAVRAQNVAPEEFSQSTLIQGGRTQAIAWMDVTFELEKK